MERLQPVDLWILAGWLVFTFLVGLWFSRRASRSTEDFFVSGRSLPWWVVGTSMVATTFAADTPLAVSGWVASKGIHANWAWWTLGFAGMASVFLFARLWRRSGILTDAELVELRYGGRPAAVLRVAKAIWFGVFQNVLVIAWVMAAMKKITQVVLDLEPDSRVALLGMLDVPSWAAIALALFVVSVVYTSASGMWGVVSTDVVQFVLAITLAVVFAAIAWDAVDGLEGVRASFAQHGLDWEATARIVPPLDSTAGGEFLLLVGVVWWGQHNVDGGGYLAQRLFAARDERHAVLGYLWFTVAHICLRPWPWILVGLAGMALLGPAGEGLAVTDAETYYPLLMRRLLPTGLYGLMLASFLAAFMSTIDTQLNWGASLLVNDVYRRFVDPEADEAKLVRVSRFAILLLAALGAAASLYVDQVVWAWTLAFSVTAGIGTVYAARWYWWRTNAWSEIAAMAAAALSTSLLLRLERGRPEGWTLAEGAVDWLSFPGGAALTTLVTVAVWVTVTWLTRPVERAHLERFYARVRPGGPGWRPLTDGRPEYAGDGPGVSSLYGIVAGCVACYGTLLAVGWLLLGRTTHAALAGGAAVLGAGLLVRQLGRAGARGPARL